VVFGANTTCYPTGPGPSFSCPASPLPYLPYNYVWSFPGGTPSSVSGIAAPQVSFPTAGSFSVGLSVTDDIATCQASGASVTVRLPLPGWKEVKP